MELFWPITYPYEKLSSARSENTCIPLILERYVQRKGYAVVKALHYKPKVAGSIPDGVIGIFH